MYNILLILVFSSHIWSLFLLGIIYRYIHIYNYTNTKWKMSGCGNSIAAENMMWNEDSCNKWKKGILYLLSILCFSHLCLNGRIRISLQLVEASSLKVGEKVLETIALLRDDNNFVASESSFPLYVYSVILFASKLGMSLFLFIFIF